MITVVCYLWYDPKGKNNAVYIYGPEHVRMLKSMVDRHLHLPHRFVCISDREIQGIETISLDMATHVPHTRYAKLMTFRPDAASVIGERILQLDLDTVITRNIDPLVDRPESLVLWRNPCWGERKRTRYNTSMLLLTAGTRPDVWIKFDRTLTPALMARHWGGTDQAWISHCAGPDAPHWTQDDGVYGAGRLRGNPVTAGTVLPDNARIVFFPGRREPTMRTTQEKHPWIQEHLK
jgi:hypothetical protein